jgi:sugar/nucleoside kinase (ribokinase family)
MYYPKTDLLCIGSIVADFVMSNMDGFPEPGKVALVESMGLHPGGCAVNTSSAFAKIGGTVRLIGKIGDDPIGNTMLSKLKHIGVATDCIVATSMTTAVSIVLVTSYGERTFIYYPGPNSLLSAKNINLGIIPISKILHISDVFLLQRFNEEELNSILKIAKLNGLTTSLDTCWDPSGRWISLIKRNMQYIDLFFCNLEEAEMLTGQKNTFKSSEILFGLGPKLVIIKMGEDGSFIRGNNFTIKTNAIKVDVKDTTGAGDCFVAGFLYGFLKKWDLELIAKFANVVGGACVTEQGASDGVRSFEYLYNLMMEIL